MKLVHIIEKFFNSGAASSLKQIYDSLIDSDIITSQEVICLKPNQTDNGKPPPSWFPVQSKTYSYSAFYDVTKTDEYKNAIFVFHKLMCSPTRTIANLLNRTGKPFFAINHTYAESSAFNKLYNFRYCVAVSDHMSRKLLKANKEVKFYTIRNIVDCDFANTYSKPEKEIGIFKTGRINSLNAIKYNADFVRWVCSLNLNKKHMHEYVGAGQYMNEALEICSSSKNQNSSCIMCGSINNDKIKFEKIKSWDIFLYHINRPEGTSMSVLESLACGVPVVCCDLPGNNELIHNGVNGFVFKNFNEAQNILEELAKDDEKLNNLKNSTANWAKHNLTKNYLKKQYEDAISDIAKTFHSKSSAKSLSHVHSKKEIADRQIARKEKVKKALAERYANKEAKKETYPQRDSKKKQIGSHMLHKKDSLNLNNNSIKKKYVPFLSLNNIMLEKNISSDFIGICVDDCVDVDYGKYVHFEELDDGEMFLFNYENKTNIKILNIKEFWPIKKTEIIFINSRNLDYIKNIILK